MVVCVSLPLYRSHDTIFDPRATPLYLPRPLFLVAEQFQQRCRHIFIPSMAHVQLRMQLDRANQERARTHVSGGIHFHQAVATLQNKSARIYRVFDVLSIEVFLSFVKRHRSDGNGTIK